MTLAQHEVALLNANAVRLDQARIKRETRTLGSREGLLRVAQMLREPSANVGRMRLAYALRCVHRVNGARSGMFLRSAGVRESRLSARVSDLTNRERESLAAELERRAG